MLGILATIVFWLAVLNVPLSLIAGEPGRAIVAAVIALAIHGARKK